MKKIFYLITVAVLFTIAACKEDKCEGVVCLNGGTCQDGTCECNSAFTGDRCQTHTNGCDTTRCYYGGYCANNICNCPGHTSGDSCTILETPSKMYITQITVNHFHPANFLGITWDADRDNSPADIYPVIRRNGIVIFNGHADNINYCYKPNANYDTQYNFILHEDSVGITDVTNPNYHIELWDYDDGINPDDSMYGFNITPFTGLEGFPGSFAYHDTTFYNDEFEFRVRYSDYYEW